MSKKNYKKMDVSPFENKGEAIPSNKAEKPIEPMILPDKAVVIRAHDGLEIGYFVGHSTPEIINMMVAKGFWRYATSED